MGLTKDAKKALAGMAPGYLDDLCNALAGMGVKERNEFVKGLVARAPHPMKPDRPFSSVEDWWEEKVRTGITLSARPEDGWVQEFRVSELRDDYIEYTKRTGITKVGAATGMGRFVKKVLPTNKTSSIKCMSMYMRRMMMARPTSRAR